MKTLFFAALAATTISISACSGDPQLVADPPYHREAASPLQAAQDSPAQRAMTPNEFGEFGIAFPRLYYGP